MKHISWALLLVTVIATTASCTHKEQTSTSTESGGTATTTSSAAPSAETATNAPASGKQFVTFQFNDVAVTTGGNPILRLGFTEKNNGTDPVLCEESMFTLQLSDGTILPPDAGAENRCDPDTVDPGSTGKGTMFFDLKPGYSGAVTLLMTQDNAVVGRGTTQVH